MRLSFFGLLTTFDGRYSGGIIVTKGQQRAEQRGQKRKRHRDVTCNLQGQKGPPFHHLSSPKLLFLCLPNFLATADCFYTESLPLIKKIDAWCKTVQIQGFEQGTISHWSIKMPERRKTGNAEMYCYLHPRPRVTEITPQVPLQVVPMSVRSVTLQQ